MGELVAGIIDVFADGPLTGNPLAVVQDADGLSDIEMRRIAGEFKQAETTFILASHRADRKLRSFTAMGTEVTGFGHNALGAWLWLGEQGALGPLSDPVAFQQEIGSRILPIELVRADRRVCARMHQPKLTLGETLHDFGALATALGLDTGDILPEPRARVADAGASHLMVRVRNVQVVDRAEPAADALFGILNSVRAEGCYVYAFNENSGDSAYARFFNPTVGLWEDAATGSAAGPLAGYLGAVGALKRDRLTVEQGTKMGRRSILQVRLTPYPELRGTGVVVLRGTLRI